MCGIFGIEGHGEAANLTYLGRQKDMDAVYRRVSVFIRIPERDSLSAMVLEMLARQRWVIYNKRMPHVDFAGNILARREGSDPSLPPFDICIGERHPVDSAIGPSPEAGETLQPTVEPTTVYRRKTL